MNLWNRLFDSSTKRPSTTPSEGKQIVPVPTISTAAATKSIEIESSKVFGVMLFFCASGLSNDTKASLEYRQLEILRAALPHLHETLTGKPLVVKFFDSTDAADAFLFAECPIMRLSVIRQRDPLAARNAHPLLLFCSLIVALLLETEDESQNVLIKSAMPDEQIIPNK